MSQCGEQIPGTRKLGSKPPHLEVPEDIFQTACGIVMNAKSLKSMLRHTDVVDAIALALKAERVNERIRMGMHILRERSEAASEERERCAEILREWVNLCGDTEIKWTSAREYALGAILDTLECIESGAPFPSVSPSNQKQEGE